MAISSLADNTQVWRVVRDRTVYEKRVTPGEQDSDNPTYQRRWVWLITLTCRVETATVYGSTSQYNAIRSATFSNVAGKITVGGVETTMPFLGTWYVDECDIVHEQNGWTRVTLSVSQEGDWPGDTGVPDYDVDAVTTTTTTT